MKKPFATICALCALGLGATLVLAQAPPTGAAPDPQARMAQLAKDLSLTDAQKPKFAQILETERTDLGASMKQEREQNIDVPLLGPHRCKQPVQIIQLRDVALHPGDTRAAALLTALYHCTEQEAAA